MKYDVITIGDAFEDVFVLPKGLKIKKDSNLVFNRSVSFGLGQKIPLENVEYEIGGSACNTAVGFARAGFKTSLITVLGDDTPAEKIIQRLDKKEVDRSNLIIDKGLKTNFSVIFRIDGDRTIFIYHGLTDYGKLRLKKNLNSSWIFLAPIGENIEGLEKDIIAKIAEKNVKLAWNPGTIQIEKGMNRFKNLLSNTEVLFLNREEAIKFTHHNIHPNDETVFKKIAYFGPKIIVMTSGKDGAKAFDGKNFYSIKANENLKIIDSTGAGDAFASGFLNRIISSEDNNYGEDLISEALTWGIANSESVISFIGAQFGLLDKNSILDQASKNQRNKVLIN